jgi:predicted GNAT superfamily acetyltransferase
MAEAVSIRPLQSVDDTRAASALFDRIWGERRVMGTPLLRAMAAHGGQVLGAFDGDELVGALVGLVGLTEDGRPVVHSHITGVAPDVQHRGVGFRLKRAQRDWCLARGIDVVTWTMDPMVARNARFNLHKLGAVGSAFHRDYYGPMEDALNRGERSDRLEIRWDLRSDRVAAAMQGRVPEPVVTETVTLVRVPEDYHALRERDEAEARRWRDRAADELEAVLGSGYQATGFLREGAYVLERR